MDSYYFLCSSISALYDCDSCEDFAELWNALCTLNERGIIPDSLWIPFTKVFDGLMYDDELGQVVNYKF